ncbi:MAG: TetR/AcrR family transcriptional regulator [Acidobacteriota bacterium]|nr:TetR/AcrR family transcriptional regulator [Acidobacteriota bacterium]
MQRPASASLQPRKKPSQARSTASVEAILDATLQVLLAVGKERLTTTRVAQRAGVSVGTLYQYFPNKSSLLQACLKRHMGEVSRAVEEVCAVQRNGRLLAMGTSLVDAYLEAKLRNARASAALYAVSSDVDGAAISREARAKSAHTVAAYFATAQEGLTRPAAVVATMVLAAMHGTLQRVLEAKSPQAEADVLRTELLTLLHGYLQACAAAPTD